MADTMKRRMLGLDVASVDGLIFEDAAIPEPGPGEVRIRVRAVSLDTRDPMVIEQGSMRLPGVDLAPASAMAGIVDAVAEGVDGWSAGDAVVDLHFRGWHDGAMPVDAASAA